MKRGLLAGAFALVAVIQSAAIAEADPVTVSGYMNIQHSFVYDFAFKGGNFDLHHFAPNEFGLGLHEFPSTCLTEPCGANGFPTQITWNGTLGADGTIGGTRYDTIFDEDVSEDPLEGVDLQTTLQFAFDRTVAVPPASAGDTVVTAPFTLTGHLAARPSRSDTLLFSSDITSHGTARIHFTFDQSVGEPRIADSVSFAFDGAPTPEPATLSLFAVGALMRIGRRRTRTTTRRPTPA